jgi:3-hydroxymyristoyl/3-hydroxydecanoyl-(acyl carrier protein) dehydratase
LYRFHVQKPATAESQEVAGESDVVEVDVPGFVVVSQTCDIQRVAAERPFVTVCALIQCPEWLSVDDVRKCLRPRYAFVPGVASLGLVADLDQVMTIEKPLLTSWQSNRGCMTDGDQRAFAAAVARKFARFAFPDDFVQLLSDFNDLIKRKHGRMQSEEGQSLAALREIRVAATPDWNASSIQLHFTFVRHDEQTDAAGQSWAHWLAKWLAKIPKAGRYGAVHGVVSSLSEIRADEYLVSDQLDLDHLSRSEEGTD